MGPRPLIGVHTHWGALGLCAQAAGQGAHPPRVSGVGPRPLIRVRAYWGTLGLGPQAYGLLIRVCPHQGFQLWAPSPLFWVHVTLLQVCAGAGHPAFTVQGLRGEGCQRPWLLWRVL